jgi:hypothetical protein
MKSVKIYDKQDRLLLSVTARGGKRKGEYDFQIAKDLEGYVTIDVRDDKGCKITHDHMRQK